MTELERFVVDNEDLADVYMTDAEYCSDPDRKAMYIKAAEGHRQIAALLRELAERRKEPKIVRCGECRHRDPEDKKCDCGHDIIWQLPRGDNWYCADAERRTE